MREIKFNYVFQHGETGRIYTKTFDIEDLENYDTFSYPANYGVIARRQYTGLFDKQGVEIYEGDILKVDRQLTLYSYYIVAWNERRAMFSLAEIGSDFIESFYDWVDTDAFSVIGNIYEHLHLLGGE